MAALHVKWGVTLARRELACRVRSIPKKNYKFITRHSLVERRARYLFYCMFVCLFVNDFSKPAGRFTPYFARGRSLGQDVSSPLLGVGGSRRAEKEANYIFVTMGVNGEFLHFGGF